MARCRVGVVPGVSPPAVRPKLRFDAGTVAVLPSDGKRGGVDRGRGPGATPCAATQGSGRDRRGGSPVRRVRASGSSSAAETAGPRGAREPTAAYRDDRHEHHRLPSRFRTLRCAARPERADQRGIDVGRIRVWARRSPLSSGAAAVERRGRRRAAAAVHLGESAPDIGDPFPPATSRYRSQGPAVHVAQRAPAGGWARGPGAAGPPPVSGTLPRGSSPPPTRTRRRAACRGRWPSAAPRRRRRPAGP